MTVELAVLESLRERELPGGTIEIPRHESFIADHAVRAPGDPDVAHPVWFIVASLRCMGISVDELMALASAGPHDVLLYGQVDVSIERPLLVGRTYRAAATIVDVGRSAMRDDTVLDRIVVRVAIGTDEDPHGVVEATYLFKRGD
ncbi:hypothetical protein [Georgenia sp. SYP-B2076]|uniref:hypothetical protein n=1 Tax=Georgenia sp. SYP-B2076 TaxID=2495881 RepID=UPI000F8C58B7|nr:hypothetical protein [Georgenia sp. SYP-B2076]